MAGVMIAKDGEQLTPKIFQKLVIKLLEPTTASEKQGIRLRNPNVIPSDSTLSYAPAVHVTGDHVPAVPSKRELKTWDELTLRSREARLKLGVDHLRAALETLREVVGMCDEDLQPSSLEGVSLSIAHSVSEPEHCSLSLTSTSALDP